MLVRDTYAGKGAERRYRPCVRKSKKKLVATIGTVVQSFSFLLYSINTHSNDFPRGFKTDALFYSRIVSVHPMFLSALAC